MKRCIILTITLLFSESYLLSMQQDTINHELSIFIESNNRPMYLCALLESLSLNGKNHGSIQVLYRANSLEMHNAYQHIKANFNDVVFTLVRDIDSFKGILSEKLSQTSASYVALAEDIALLYKPVDFKHCIEWLEHMNAMVFCLGLGKNICYNRFLPHDQIQPQFVFLDEDVYAWDLQKGEHDWRYCVGTDLSICHKDRLLATVQSTSFNTMQALSAFCAQYFVSAHDSVGLCAEVSSVLRVQFIGNRVGSDDLCTLFNYGFKVDIAQFFDVTVNQLYYVTHPVLKPRVVSQYAA